MDNFDPTAVSPNSVSWVYSSGCSLPTQSREMSANGHISEAFVSAVLEGNAISDVSMLAFRDPKRFVAGELHRHLESWSHITSSTPCDLAPQVLNWIENSVDVHEFFNTSRAATKVKLTTLHFLLLESFKTTHLASRLLSSSPLHFWIDWPQVPSLYGEKLERYNRHTR